MANRYFIVGGAGFIGSHFVARLLQIPATQSVTIYDNFSSGRDWHLAPHRGNAKFAIVRDDVRNADALRKAMTGHDVVIHLASNPDIARAVTEPTIDFDEGTLLTNNVLEAMRITGAKRLLYASGSGVYGDLGLTEARESHGPLLPISTYGASKLAGEALICSYAHMFGLTACAFRFGNVVGPRQTHGVGLDFVRRLREAPTHLQILGDGTQSKSYIHVDDIVRAVLIASAKCVEPFSVFNVATGDYITVREIAELAVECVGLSAQRVCFDFTGGDRGWKGDVPIVRLNTDRIQALGWQCERRSREALRHAMLSLLGDVDAGRIGA